MSDSPAGSWLIQLQESGYRITAPRRAIVEILATGTRALEPVELFDIARVEYPGLGLVTVYRTLERLEALRLIQRVHQPGGCNRYLRAVEGHQHLLLCTRCGKADFFSGDELDSLSQEISTRSGFFIQEHWLQLFGLCPQCAAVGEGD